MSATPATVPAQAIPAEAAAAGRALRARVGRRALGEWTPAPGRGDIAARVLADDADRLPDLVALRHARLGADPFAFLRGTASLMAADLASRPVTGLRVQCSGDAHLANFGWFASPERNLVFDVTDFDETLPGPWEYDVKRLVASVAVAAMVRGARQGEARDAATAAAAGYRDGIAAFAAMGTLEAWYARVDAAEVLATLRRGTARDRAAARGALEAAVHRDRIAAVAQLTETGPDGARRFTEHPPLVSRAAADDVRDELTARFAAYLASMPPERAALLGRFRLTDVARKVVGVGSVGSRCYVALLVAREDEEPLILQAKEARASVLEAGFGSSALPPAERVVVGQRLTQAAPDPFLGWAEPPPGATGEAARSFYWRQLWDEKGALPLGALAPVDLGAYGAVCARVLARAHARTGDAAQIAGYVGTGAAFADAMGSFGLAYAAQVEADHAAFTRALAGPVPAR